VLADAPDLRPILADPNPDALAELLDAFDVEVTYDKANQTLDLAATVTAELVSPPETLHRLVAGRSCDIAGARCEPATGPAEVQASLPVPEAR
jgi:hypothetical protein